MKQLIFICITAFALCTMNAYSQQVDEGSEPFQKTRQNGFSMVINYPAKTVEEAIKERMKQDNVKGGKSKGMLTYKEINFPTIADTQIDLYIKIAGDKNSSTVYVFVSKGYENFISSSSDPDIAANTRRFVQTLAIDVYNYDLKTQTASQQKEVDKLQKKYDNLVEKQTKLDKEVDDSRQALDAQKNSLTKLQSTSQEKY